MCWVCAVRLHCQISNNVSLDSWFIWPQQTAWWQTIEWDMQRSQFHQMRGQKKKKHASGFLLSPWNVKYSLFLNPDSCSYTALMYVHLNGCSRLWCCLCSKWKVFCTLLQNKIHGNSWSCLLVKLQLAKFCLYALIWRTTANERALRSKGKGNKKKVSFTYKRKRQKRDCEIYDESQNLWNDPWNPTCGEMNSFKT